MQTRLVGALALMLFAFGAANSRAWASETGTVLPEENARRVVVDFMQAVNSLHARFEQVLQDDKGQTLETDSGELWLQRPGRFRWRYSEPSEREIVADTENIWLYDADLDQVTVRPVENAVAESPAALLVGNISALEDYDIRGLRTSDGVVLVTLLPRAANGDFQSVELGFNSGELASLELNDRFGQRTTIRFSAIERNPQIAPSVFDFILPDGADVIDQRAK